MGPGPAWARGAGPACMGLARLGPGPGLGPCPAWAWARLGLGLGLGPGLAWAWAPQFGLFGCDLPRAKIKKLHPSQYNAAALVILGWNSYCRVRPALRKAGRAFSLGGQITDPFDAARLRFGGERVSMPQDGLGCKLPCARRVAPNIGAYLCC